MTMYMYTLVMKIYRVTDRIPVKMGELTFWFSPLKWEHKILVANSMRTVEGRTNVTTSRAKTSIKYALKAIDGLQNHDGTPLVLDLDSEGNLTDDSVEDVLLLEEIQSLVRLSLAWLNGPVEVELEGVSVDFSGTQSTKKKT